MIPLVSAIITTFNCERYVAEAVQSVLDQDFSPIEVIVIDDGSTDSTKELLRRFEGRVRYVRQENGGTSKARNRGIREAKGELIAFLDADDQWLPSKTTKQVAFLAANPAVSLVHCDLEIVREATGERWRVPKGQREVFSGDCYERIFFGHSISPSASMIRRSSLDQVGLFDESIRGPSFEDEDLWLRLARRSQFGYIPEALVLYRFHSSNGSYNALRNDIDEYRVLTKTLREDPTLWKRLGAARIRAHLYSLAFSAGYRCLDAGRATEARKHFWSSQRHTPFNPLPAAMFIFSYIPHRLLEPMREWRRRVLGTERRS